MARKKRKEFSVIEYVDPAEIKSFRTSLNMLMTDHDNKYLTISRALIMYLYPNEFKVMAFLITMSAQYGALKISFRKMAEMLKLGRNDVKAYIDTLVKIGLIEYIFNTGNIKVIRPDIVGIEKLESMCSGLSMIGFSQLRNELWDENIKNLDSKKIKNAISKSDIKKDNEDENENDRKTR